MKTTVFRAFCTVSLLLSWACNSDRTARNEDNAYFTQAVEFQEQQQYVAAAEAFQLCLRYSPESTLAHLQLAMLYEDHLNDLPRAIVHYQAYLNADVHDNEATVAKWLERAERRHYEVLAERSGGIKTPEPPVVDTESAPPPAELPPLVATVVYTVEAGDTLSGISKKLFGTTRHWELLYQINAADISDPARLSIGQQLKVPEITDE